MKYMLLCYDDMEYWEKVGSAVHRAAMDEAVQLTHELNGRGQYLTAAPLHPVATATSVRLREGRRLVTDGPFAETREQLGGYFIIEAKNLEEAVSVAAEIPGARRGTVEIRRIMEIDGLPEV